MTITQMLSQSAILTVLGMGVVFAFLVVLVFAMNIVKWIIIALKLDKEEGAPVVSGATDQSTDKKSVVAAIAAALKIKR